VLKKPTKRLCIEEKTGKLLEGVIERERNCKRKSLIADKPQGDRIGRHD